jgi:predicted SAM-dependent methyltransferase
MASAVSAVKRQTTRGLRRSIREVWTEARILRRHRAGVRRARRLAAPSGGFKLHLGCGSNSKPGWVNVDLFNAAADLALDLREPLPFADNSVAVLYSEHLLEHFTYPDEVQRLLREWLRVLSPGGIVKIGVPDHGAVLQAYARGDMQFFDFHRLRSYLRDEHVTLMHQVNYWFRQDGLHKYSYDEETLGQTLRNAGFTDVAVRAFEPELDSEKRKPRTLYMSATKPRLPGAAPRTPAPAYAEAV